MRVEIRIQSRIDAGLRDFIERRLKEKAVDR
jgi:hypothetical protein